MSASSPTVQSGEDEHTWRWVLAQAPAWSPPAKRTVVVVPHPDDEVLGSGGLIAHQRRRSVEVHVVAVSDGEAAYANGGDLAAVRTSEQQQALEWLGVPADHILRLGLPDGRVRDHVDILAGAVAGLLDAETLLVAPWRHDVHPDHEACGEAAEQAAATASADLTS